MHQHPRSLGLFAAVASISMALAPLSANAQVSRTVVTPYGASRTVAGPNAAVRTTVGPAGNVHRTAVGPAGGVVHTSTVRPIAPVHRAVIVR